MNELVSIIIPSYNRGALIGETIRSLQLQTHENWEAIIVDDLSTDDTKEVVKKFTIYDKRIIYIERTREPKGAPVCRNIGLSQAKGTFVIFLDSDDMLSPSCLERRVNQFLKCPDCQFLIFNGAFFNDSIQEATVLWNRFDERSDLERFLKGDSVWQTSAPIWKRSFFSNTGHSFNETVLSSQDWEFHVRALLKQPVYKKINTVPDFFIRRSIGYSKISDGHWTKEKILKRIELYEHIIDQYLLTASTKEYNYYVLLIIIKQYHYLLKIVKSTFDDSILNSLVCRTPSKKPFNITLGIFYLKTGNRLLKINPAFYKVFRKFCELTFLNKLLENNSKYRSAMTDVEVEALQNEVSNYP